MGVDTWIQIDSPGSPCRRDGISAETKRIRKTHRSKEQGEEHPRLRGLPMKRLGGGSDDLPEVWWERSTESEVEIGESWVEIKGPDHEGLCGQRTGNWIFTPKAMGLTGG